MPRTLPKTALTSTAPRFAASAPRLIVAAIGGGSAAMLAGAVALWLHYGTAVFHEMILSGISACF